MKEKGEVKMLAWKEKGEQFLKPWVTRNGRYIFEEQMINAVIMRSLGKYTLLLRRTQISSCLSIFT